MSHFSVYLFADGSHVHQYLLFVRTMSLRLFY